jgi:hypothetical protein
MVDGARGQMIESIENRWRKCPSVFRGLKKSLERLNALEKFFDVLGVSLVSRSQTTKSTLSFLTG